MVSPAKLFYMAVWRNWLSLKRYKLDFILGLVTSILFGFGMLLMALAFDASLLERTVGTSNWVSFQVLGIAYQSWQGLALWGAARMFRDELSTGQIDYVFTCPFPRYGYILSNVAALAVQQGISFIPTLAVGLWFTRSTLTLGGVFLGLLATMLSVGALSQLGACFAGLVLRHRKISSVFGFLNFAFQILTGMFIPMQLLPVPLRLMGIALLPQTFGIDLLRHYVMGTHTILAAPYEWAILLTQFVVLGALGWFSVRRLEQKAREEGLHYL